MRRRRALPTLVAATALVLTGCSGGPGGSAEPSALDALLDRHDLAGLSGQEVVDRLEGLETADRPTDLVASVRAAELVLADESYETTVPLPEDTFYLSVAPFVDETHECFYHSLTTCQGELADEPVSVTVVDAATGEVLVEEDTTLGANGFVGLWLPRDVDAELRVEHEGRVGTTTVSTGADDPTCLTTLQLA
ncbi:CueP family metal-binding protein [Cellulosimicrobium cellulans]|uniref:CueP family metal-binding protein n=1 Tax=Cellulosimicrobium cellulans TaxID=1710 RepID=UPI0006A7D3EF|nr:CueP family metal-binding protein [Cellulosimicrobium cellulans]